MFPRPTKLDEIIGQTDIVKRIKISVEASLTQNKIFPHSLLFGPAGFGKTSLAGCIANELDKNILITNGANLKTTKDILPYLPKLKSGILFVDEAHRISNEVQDFLLPVLEDFHYSLGKKIKLNVEPFILILGTTNIGALCKPLRDRCTYQYSLMQYQIDDIATIIEKNANQADHPLDKNCCITIAKSARGNPRIGLARLRWVLDYSVSHNISITTEVIKSALKLAKISDDGIEEHDRRYLDTVKRLGPISLSSLSASLDIDKDTIKEVIEPFLLSKELIKITSRGRTTC